MPVSGNYCMCKLEVECNNLTLKAELHFYIKCIVGSERLILQITIIIERGHRMLSLNNQCSRSRSTEVYDCISAIGLVIQN